MILKLFGAGDQNHRKNECFYSKIVNFLVKTNVL